MRSIVVALLCIVAFIVGVHSRAFATTALACPYPVSSASPYIGPRINFDQTDGDILAGTAMTINGIHELAIGGNFRHVITPDGVYHAASNLAVIREDTGQFIAAINTNSYVRAVFAISGVLYAGGDFTVVNGVARSHIVGINVNRWVVNTFNPGSSGPVRAIAGLAGRYPRIFYGDNGRGFLIAVTPLGAGMWHLVYTGGVVTVLSVSPEGKLYAGGLYEKMGAFVQHGADQINPTTGAINTSWRGVFATDPPPGTGDRGQEPLSITHDTSLRPSWPVFGWGGGTTNGVTELSPQNGSQRWHRGNRTEGDSQAVAMVGSNILVGNHRNHGNTTVGCPYQYFTSVHTNAGVVLTGFDPRLTGNQSNADGGNNGVQAIVHDPVTKTVYLFGAFTTLGATCPLWNTCVGGTHLQSIAKYATRS